jgi:hypothetical protein
MDTLLVTVHLKKMPVKFGGAKTMGRPVEIMSHLKKVSLKLTRNLCCYSV